MAMVAFFPWTTVEAKEQYGTFSLIPYKKGAEPCGHGSPEQALLDRIIGCYRTPNDHSIQVAAILQLGPSSFLRDLSEDERTEFFEFSEILAFGGLAKRQYFGHSFG